MTRLSDSDAIWSQQQADEVMYDFYGISGRDQFDRMKAAPFAKLPIDQAVKIIDGDIGGTDIAAIHAEWAREEAQRRGPGGRPPTITSRTMLILLLMHAIAGESLSVRNMTYTLEWRLDRDDMEAIGLGEVKVDGLDWYTRLDTAYNTLIEPIDQFPMPKYDESTPVADRITRRKKLTGKQRVEYAAFLESISGRIKKRRKRLDDLVFEIPGNVVRQARDAGLLKGFSGDIALDGTFTKVDGKASNQDLSQPARSTNNEAGAWGRKGNHSSQGPLLPGQSRAKGTSKKYKFGFEADIVTMTAGRPNIPDLILGVNLHRPGAIKAVSKTLFPRIDSFGLPTGTIAVDRAYNGLKTESFHEVLLQHGYDFVFDYKVSANSKQLGAKASFFKDDIGYLLVEGTWYLDLMPKDLVNASIHAALPTNDPLYVDPDTYAKRIKAREDYQLTTHGSRDPDGFQRYNLPNPDRYIAYDENTGELLAKPTRKTVSIPLATGLKWQQKHPYKSEAWQKAYNLRSGVERKNGQLKHTKFEALDDAGKRTKRGGTAHAIAVAMLITAHNLRTIENFIRAAEGIDNRKSSRRKPRRNANEKLVKIRKQRDGRAAA